MESILIVDDNADLRMTLSDILREEGFDTFAVEDGKAAIKKVKKVRPDLALLDIKLPGMDGVELLEEMKRIDKNLIIIMLTAFGEVKDAVRAMKLGAFDYITKPFDNEELVLVIRKALQSHYLSREVEILRKRLGEKTALEQSMGKSSVIMRVISQAKIVAPTTMTVLIQGESGTGKELLAQMIHESSPRKDKPFVAVDCGAIPETLVESELFGHERGAFTGADALKEGKFEQAQGGSIFLDEVGNLTENVQVKLLRALQERRIQHLGGRRGVDVDVRVIVATNVNLTQWVKQGKFRRDLFHRLNEFCIALPPLRQRKDDIVMLADHFLKEANEEFGKKAEGFSKAAVGYLLEYGYPGNVRELRNMVRRAVLMACGGVIEPEYMSPDAPGAPLEAVNDVEESLELKVDLNEGASFEEIRGRVERSLITKAIALAGGNKVKAAKMLQMNRKALYRKMKKLGISINGEGTE